MRGRAWGRIGDAACAALAVAVLASCQSEQQTLPPAVLPAVVRATIVPGPHNVLSAVATVATVNADSVLMRFGVVGQPLDSFTPAAPVESDVTDLPVLGLLPETSYQFQVVAFGEGVMAAGDTLRLTTGPLPADLPVYSAGGGDPSPGYVVFGAYPYGVVIDNTGRIVWYRHLDGGPTLNFQVQPTGRYTTSPITPAPGDATPWIEFDPLGNEVRRLGCADGLIARFHDLIAEPDGSYWLMCDETRIMDLTPYGGQPAAAVTGTVVQHVDAAGTRLFSWSPFGHFAITDLDSASRSGASVNWTHGNAIDFDTDGNLLVSFRSLSEITKIDLATGSVLWRLGGLANQFTLSGTLTPFIGQHGLRVVGPGRLLLLDNRGLAASRAERYVLDEAGRIATLLESYSAQPPVTAILGGSTQLLPGGRVLVAYGNGNRVQEYDAAGNVVWEIHDNPGYVFRAQRITSLYRPGVGQPH
jgi:outer membrane protein assembly factor BamB